MTIEQHPTNSSLPGPLKILSQSWAIYKQRIGTFLGITIIPFLISILLLAVFNFISNYNYEEWLINRLTDSGSGVYMAGLIIILTVLFTIIIYFIQIWSQVALIYAVKDREERINVIESYRRGWHKIFPFWWLSILMGFIILGAFLFLIIPGIIFATWFSLAFFILIAEDLKGMDALLKSKEYVKGKWSQVFGRFLFIGGLLLIIYLIPIIVFNVLKFPLAEEITQSVVGLFLSPLVIIYGFLIYSNLKLIKGDFSFLPSVKQKATFVIIAIIGILIIPILFLSIFFSSLGSAREKAKDAQRQSDIRQISLAMEMFYDYENDTYLSSETMPQVIGDYLDPAPKDPLGSSYFWIDNTVNNEYFCIYAELSDGGYFAASHKGTKQLNIKPFSVDCW